jgi:hypothetical protein
VTGPEDTGRRVQTGQDRVSPSVDAGEANAVTERASGAPAVSVKSRRRLVTLALVAGVLGGGGLSVAPRADRVVVSSINRTDNPSGAEVQVQMTESSRGMPFRTWTVRRGPVGSDPPTHREMNANVSAVPLNMAVVGILVLVLFGPAVRRRSG